MLRVGAVGRTGGGCEGRGGGVLCSRVGPEAQRFLARHGGLRLEAQGPAGGGWRRPTPGVLLNPK